MQRTVNALIEHEMAIIKSTHSLPLHDRGLATVGQANNKLARKVNKGRDKDTGESLQSGAHIQCTSDKNTVFIVHQCEHVQCR